MSSRSWQRSSLRAAGHGEPVEYHQDWSYTDERSERALLVWIPLVDVGWSNGALSFVSGSHRWTRGVRGDDLASPATPFQSELDGLAELLPLDAGQGVVYDPAVIHGSSRNVTPNPRPVAAVGFAPRGARLIHFHRAGAEPLRGVEVDESYFTAQPFRSPPPDGRRVDAWAPPVEAADLAVHLAARRASARVDSPPDWAGRVLRSRRRARRLDRNGFVTFRWLGASEAAAVAHAVRRVVGPHADGAWPAGTSDHSPSSRAMAAVLADRLGRPLEHHLGSRPSLGWTISCLRPGEGGRADGRRRPRRPATSSGADRGYEVLVALDDVTGHNGQVRVRPGSHRPEVVVSDDDGCPATIPLAAGEGVVLHERLRRTSYPNHTDRVRLVAVGTLPRRLTPG